MTFIDMFCGMGTVRMGFEKANWECVYSIEWDKHKRKIYEVIFGREPESSDICAVRGTDLPISDCWCFGAPCQDFSIAGIRAGLGGDRSSLVREVFRLVRETPEEHRPEWLLYENVKGMLSSNKGLDYLEILFEMASLGYDIQYQLLNSKDFGVPQNRERVYTLGHSRRFGQRKVFPIGEDGGITDGESREKLPPPQIVGTLTSTDFKQHGDGTYIIENTVKTINSKNADGKEPPQQDRIYETDGLMTALSSQLGGRYNILEPCACLTPDRLEKRQNGRRFKEPGEPMFTLTKQDIHGVLITDNDLGKWDRFEQEEIDETEKDVEESEKRIRENGVDYFGRAILRPVRNEYGKAIRKEYENGKVKESRHKMTQLEPRPDGISNTLSTVQKDNLLQCKTRIRRLTPRECMRLQGVPDCITDKLIAAEISDTQMYRAAGDACTVNVIYEIAHAMTEQTVEGAKP